MQRDRAVNNQEDRWDRPAARSSECRHGRRRRWKWPFDFESKPEKRNAPTAPASKFYIWNRNFMNVVRAATRTWCALERIQLRASSWKRRCILGLIGNPELRPNRVAICAFTIGRRAIVLRRFPAWPTIGTLDHTDTFMGSTRTFGDWLIFAIAVAAETLVMWPCR